MTIHSFKDLDAWKEGHKLVLMAYKETQKFPREEIFGITNQIRRAAVSITSNLAEGFSRQSYKDKVQFYCIALGSLTELQNQIIICKDIGYISPELYSKFEEQSTIEHRIINGLIKSSKNHNS